MKKLFGFVSSSSRHSKSSADWPSGNAAANQSNITGGGGATSSRLNYSPSNKSYNSQERQQQKNKPPTGSAASSGYRMSTGGGGGDASALPTDKDSTIKRQEGEIKQHLQKITELQSLVKSLQVNGKG